jgi:hypothetical protein
MPKPLNSPQQRIDQYIDAAAPFAQAICKKLRSVILNADPSITEEWKWGPHYTHQGVVCGFGAFQKHVSLVFFRGALMKDPQKLFVEELIPAKSTRCVKFSDVKEVSARAVTSYVREAVALNAAGVSAPAQELHIPADLRVRLDKSTLSFFNSLSYTHRKEYIRWIESAKKPETRTVRLQKTIQMLKQKNKHP